MRTRCLAHRFRSVNFSAFTRTLRANSERSCPEVFVADEAGPRIGEVMATVVSMNNPGVPVVSGDRAYELRGGLRETLYPRSGAGWRNAARPGAQQSRGSSVAGSLSGSSRVSVMIDFLSVRVEALRGKRGVPHGAIATVLNPAFDIAESGVFCDRAELR